MAEAAGDVSSSEGAWLRSAAEAKREGRHADAETAYRAWMDAAPADPRPRYGLALLLLERGAYAEGWALYESRASIPETGIRKPSLPMPEWRGEPVGSLLLVNEQGIGDQIQFARYVPELVARGIAVTLLAAPPVARLLVGLGAPVVPADGALQLRRTDAWCLLGSLPHLIGTIPTAPYLPSGPGGGGIGVMSTGNPRHVNDANRSIPDALRPAFSALGRDLSPTATGARDFEETAEIIRGLDLVISVDTAVAHLAGAMGKPTWLLLPRPGEWRWGQAETRTLLYPSMRLFRQQAPGDWAGVLARVKAALAEA